VTAFLVGSPLRPGSLAVGSFLIVVIHRVPYELSVVLLARPTPVQHPDRRPRQRPSGVVDILRGKARDLRQIDLLAPSIDRAVDG
jgi:hypothetical protein